MAMSCREAQRSEPDVFTFECRSCRLVMQRVKAPAFLSGKQFTERGRNLPGLRGRTR